MMAELIVNRCDRAAAPRGQFSMFELREVHRMRTRFLDRLVALLIASGLLLPSQAAEGTKTDSPDQKWICPIIERGDVILRGPKNPLDKATYLHMRLAL